MELVTDCLPSGTHVSHMHQIAHVHTHAHTHTYTRQSRTCSAAINICLAHSQVENLIVGLQVLSAAMRGAFRLSRSHSPPLSITIARSRVPTNSLLSAWQARGERPQKSAGWRNRVAYAISVRQFADMQTENDFCLGRSYLVIGKPFRVRHKHAHALCVQ